MTNGAKRAAAKRAAREARSSPALRALARGGYAANAVVHLLIGVIVIAIASGARGEGDQAGAFKTIASAPLGFVALWTLATLLAALAVWHAANGLLASRSSDVKKWGVRISEWGQAVVFLALASIAGAVALGARPNAEETAEEASRGVLDLPGGPIVLALVGVGIGVGGISFIVMGILRSFHSKVDVPDGRAGTAISALGVVGFIAKGISLSVIGILLIVAAVKVDPGTAGGLDGAIDALLDVWGGPFLVGIVGAGFVAYALFTFCRARYAKL